MKRGFIALISTFCILLCFVIMSFGDDMVLPSVRIEDCEEVTVYIGPLNKCKLNYGYTLSDYNDEVKQWSSDNTDVATVDENGVIKPLALGTANVKLETVNGLTDTIKINVVERPIIVEGEETISNDVFNDSQAELYRFVPEKSGIYEMKLVDYDADGKYCFRICIDEQYYPKGQYTYYASRNISINYDFEAGKVYYLGTAIKNSTSETRHSFVLNYVGYIPATPAPTATPEPESISVGETKTVSGNYNKFLFIPSKSGVYRYFSKGYNVHGEIRNIDSDILLGSNNYIYDVIGGVRVEVPNGDFSLEYSFKAGEKYILYSDSLYAGYYVGLEEFPLAENVEIAKEEYKLLYNMDYTIPLIYTPKDCRDAVISWVSSNSDVVTVDENGKIFGNNLGSAVVTMTTAHGYTDSIKIEVTDHPQILLDEKKTTWTMSPPAYYHFIPEVDGTYKFDSYKAWLVLYNEEFSEIESALSDDEVKWDLKAGEKYYIKVDSVEDDVAYDTYLIISYDGELPVQSSTPEVIVTNTPQVEIIPTPDVILTPTPTPEVMLTPTPEPPIILTPTPEPTEDIVLKGDVNKDNFVDAKDALEILKMAAKIIDVDEKLADITEDEVVNAEDALQVLKIAAKLI